MKNRRKPDERLHRRWLRKRRRNALKAVLRFSPYEQFKADYGTITWIGAHIKAIVCLVLNLVSHGFKTEKREPLTIYDEYFNIDHYDWNSVWVNPSWLKDWHVSIVHDGE